MEFLCIGVDSCADTVVDYIENELQQLKGNKIDYSIEVIDKGGTKSITCDTCDEKYEKNVFLQLNKKLRLHVCNALADYIIRKYEEKLIARTISSNYGYFTCVEKKEIQDKAFKIIRNEEKNILNNLFRVRRRNLIISKLMEYLENSDNLILEGFVNFRLKEYVKDLEDIADKAVDDFLMEREYKEFIRLLRYFVDMQEPKFLTIHVVIGFEDKYILLDGKGKEITSECVQEFVSELSDGEINYDDLLVSTLITFAPQKIVIHCAERLNNKQLMDTIKSVFSNKVIQCKGCWMCVSNIVKSENKK